MNIEPLESRRLMSASLDTVTQVLTVQGSAGNDVITIKKDAIGTLIVKENQSQKFFPLILVKTMVIKGGYGADTITVDPAVGIPATIRTGGGLLAEGQFDTVRGGSGSDTIYLETRGATAYGGNGSDTFYFGSAIAAQAHGEAGNDVFYAADGGTRALVKGGTGVDTLDYSAASQQLLIQNGLSGRYQSQPNFWTAYPQVMSGYHDQVAEFENFTGGKGNDIIHGNDANNVLKGGAGNDYIRGHGGRDIVYGGTGSNVLAGDSGDDFLYGRQGAKDEINGGQGFDKAYSDAIDVLMSVEGQL